MRAIQDNEINQLQEVTAFLNLETRFVQQYLDVLKETKVDWPDEYAIFSTFTTPLLNVSPEDA